jgi:hypothetical protein
VITQNVFDEKANAAAMQADGKIVAGCRWNGSSEYDRDHDIVLARYLP